MNSKKLIFCSDGIFPLAVGGMQRHSSLLIPQLARMSDWEIIVIHPHEGKKLFAEFPNIEERTVAPLPGKQNYLIEKYDYSKRVMQIILAEDKNAVIYAQGFTVWHKIEEVKNRLMINPHGLEPWQSLTWEDRLKAIPFRIIQRYIFKKAKYVVSLGGRLTHILQNDLGLSPSKIQVLPNATEFTGKEVYQERNFTSPYQFLFVGRFAENKGIYTLLDAALLLNQQGKSANFHLHLVGKGPLFDICKEKYKADNITFWGGVDDETLNNLYQKADLFVFPTLFEGMPTVILEAMKYSLPILTTDVGATKVLVDEKNGWIIEKQNPPVLATALQHFMDLPKADKITLSKASFMRVSEKFKWSDVAQSHLSVFEKM